MGTVPTDWDFSGNGETAGICCHTAAPHAGAPCLGADCGSDHQQITHVAAAHVQHLHLWGPLSIIWDQSSTGSGGTP